MIFIIVPYPFAVWMVDSFFNGSFNDPHAMKFISNLGRIYILGKAYILRHVGGDQYQLTLALPNLRSGTHTWTFFAVDHQCNTSGFIPVQYKAQ